MSDMKKMTNYKNAGDVISLQAKSIDDISYGNCVVENDYTEYFNKSLHARPIKYRSSAVVEYIDFSGLHASGVLENRCRKIRYCVNSPVSTVGFIRENERDSFFISEALLKTYPTKKLISAVDKCLKLHLTEIPADLTYGQIGTVTDMADEFYNASVFDTVIDKPELEISPLMQFTIPVYKEHRETFLRDFVKQIRAFGYELNDVTVYDVKIQPFKDRQIEVLEVLVEARYLPVAKVISIRNTGNLVH